MALNIFSKPHLRTNSCIDLSVENTVARLDNLKISCNAKPSSHGKVVESLHALLIA